MRRSLYLYQHDGELSQGAQNEIDRMVRGYQLLSDDDSVRPQRLLEIARRAEALGQTEQAIEFYHQAYDLARSVETDATAIDALTGSARLYENEREYKAALECYFECLRREHRTRDLIRTGTIWMMIGGVYSLLGELDRALDCFRKGTVKFKEGKNTYLEIKALMTVANALRMKGEYAAALTPALRSLLMFEELDDHHGITDALALVGIIHEWIGESDSARSCIERALARLDGNPNPTLHPALLLSLSHLHYSAKHYQRALDLIVPAFTVAKHLGEEPICFQFHDIASAAYEHVGNLDQALRHYRIFVRLQSAYLRHNYEQHTSIAESQIHFDLEEAERKSEKYRDEVEHLQREVYEKTRDMAMMSLDLVEKEAFLGEMKRQLSQIEGNVQDHSAGSVKLLIEDIAATMKKKEGTAWRHFEEQFNELHHVYLQILAERYPSLTLGELKICALTRLDISTKEIADMLFVSVRNVQNHRYRIRKKFGLDSKANLISFLIGIQRENS